MKVRGVARIEKLSQRNKGIEYVEKNLYTKGVFTKDVKSITYKIREIIRGRKRK